ncbi:hypothetical protein AB0K92_25260 [Streptomyces sp. NPDC052687]
MTDDITLVRVRPGLTLHETLDHLDADLDADADADAPTCHPCG